jgi:hypothetical protein
MFADIYAEEHPVLAAQQAAFEAYHATFAEAGH